MDDDALFLPTLRLSPNQIKTELFIGIHQLERMNDQLENILLLPKKEREVWVTQNRDRLNQLMDRLFEQSQLALQGVDGDVQTMQLSMEYVSHLRDVMNVMHSIFYGKKSLKA